MTYFEIYQVVV